MSELNAYMATVEVKITAYGENPKEAKRSLQPRFDKLKHDGTKKFVPDIRQTKILDLEEIE